MSFTDATLGNPVTAFVGFKNYLFYEDGEAYGLFADPEWWLAVRNTVVFAAVSVSLETVFGLLLALFLNIEMPGRNIVRAIVLIPWAIPTVASSKAWAWALNEQFGVVNDLLMRAGLISSSIAWTASGDTSLLTVIMVDVWKTTPFMTILLLAGLQSLPRECYEASRIDGIGPFRNFFFITLPLLVPTLSVAVMFRTIDALGVFDVIYILTSNNPATISMTGYARRMLVDFQDLGTGSAASVTLLVITGSIITLQVALRRYRAERIAQ
jgi:trehalose/maltose transport system permease protein